MGEHIRPCEYAGTRRSAVRTSAELFKALADETRLRILNLLARGELCVCDIMSVLDIGQSKTSRHLAYLRNVGLVDDRRDGAWMYYSLAAPNGATHAHVLAWLTEAAGHLPEAAADLRALRRRQRRPGRCGRCPSADGERKTRPAARRT
jgi:ArsR family transcriptional regulator